MDFSSYYKEQGKDRCSFNDGRTGFCQQWHIVTRALSAQTKFYAPAQLRGAIYFNNLQITSKIVFTE